METQIILNDVMKAIGNLANSMNADCWSFKIESSSGFKLEVSMTWPRCKDSIPHKPIMDPF
jgi:hypothetical protein